MNALKRLNTSKKGFTLAELLVVIAIIAILVTIAIPVFTSQLQHAKVSTDLANLRSAHAVAQTEKLINPNADEEALEKAIRDALPGVEGQLGLKGTNDEEGFTVSISGEVITVLLNGYSLADLSQNSQSTP